ALRAYLAERLPDYMVPTHMMLLPAFPLTAHGKLDRQALPAPLYPEPTGKLITSHLLEPAEELIAGIWQDLLHVSHISPDSNFFDLGGHSLLAMQVLARLRRQFGVDLPLQTLFEAPQLAELATAFYHALRGEALSPVPPLLPFPQGTALPLSFAQQRLWFLEQLAPGHPTYHVPLILELAGPLHLAALQASLSDIEARHDILRTHIEERGGQAVQVVLPPGSAASLPVIDLEGLAPAQQEHQRRHL